MKRIFLLIFTFLVLAPPQAGARRAGVADSLLRVLDDEISRRPEREAQMRREIIRLQKNLDGTTTDSASFIATRHLFNAYHAYSTDTSLIVARCARRFAARLSDPRPLWQAILMEAEALKDLGQASQSLRLLDSLPAAAHAVYGDEILGRYCANYYNLVQNTLYPPDLQRFTAQLLHYRDTLARCGRHAETRLVNAIELAKMRGEPAEAIEIYKRYADSVKVPDADGMFDFIVGEAYAATGDTATALQLYCRAAIADLRGHSCKYNALPAAANILYKQGDLERAYAYILYSLADIRAANARTRMSSVVDAVPIITHAYTESERDNRRRSTVFIIALGALALALVVAGWQVVRKNKSLQAEHTRLLEYNQQLTRMKAEVDASNRALDASNSLKDDYIGQLFNLCSDYIDIMASQHSGILKAVKSQNLHAIERAAMQLQSADRLKLFFDKFDHTFLAIFPRYVELFNSMIRPDARETPAPDTLTPEMRIVALLRLGITDTNRIARFLHYAPHTIYNYRARLRARLTVTHEAFKEAILGM